jgi:hypothetical protein
LQYCDPGDVRVRDQIGVYKTMALAAQDKQAEGAQIIQPIVAVYRERTKKNHGDVLLPVEFAAALYAQSLVDIHSRPALLQEATVQLARLPAAVNAMHETRQWRARIEKAAGGV